jgi:tetratricopeptide (TPR) repeat protein
MLYTAWGMIDLQGGRYAEAAVRFQKAVDLDATDGYAFAHLGDAELALGRVDEALAAYRQAVHWEPRLATGYAGLARCYWRLGDGKAARAALDQARAIAPGSAVVQAAFQELGGIQP